MLQKVLILLIIVFIKAVFSAADTALTYINKAKVSQMSKKDKRYKKINMMIKNHHKFYGVIEVGITMAELLASAFAAEFFVKQLADLIMYIHVPYGISISISIIIVTIILSYILLIFGGILPKRIARNNPEKIAYRLINILTLFAILNYPFEKIISISINFICKTFGIDQNDKETLSEKEIKMMILEGKDQGIINPTEKEILFNALKFDTTIIKDVMIPKENINFLNINDNFKDVLKNIEKHKYTRIPVYDENNDKVIGILNIKDIILKQANNNEIDFELGKYLRQVLFVSKKDKISTVFKTMQLNKQAMAIVLDEKQNVVGMITVEDIIEKLVGKIFDEYDS